MMEGSGPDEIVRGALREPVHRGRVERLLIVQLHEGANAEAASSELEDLPGVVSVTLNTLTRSFDIVFDPAVVSDDELAAALHHEGYDLIGWQQVRVMHAASSGSGCSTRSARSLDTPRSSTRNTGPTWMGS